MNRIEQDRQKHKNQQEQNASSNQLEQQKKGLSLFGSIYKYLFGKNSPQDDFDIQPKISIQPSQRPGVTEIQKNFIPEVQQLKKKSKNSVGVKILAAKSSPQKFLRIQQTQQANVVRVKKVALRIQRALLDIYEKDKLTSQVISPLDSRIIKPVFYFKNQPFSYENEQRIIKRFSQTNKLPELEKRKIGYEVKKKNEEQIIPQLFKKENSPVEIIPLNFKATPLVEKHKEKRDKFRLLFNTVQDAKEDSIKNDKKSEQQSSNLSSIIADESSVHESLQEGSETNNLQIKKESKKKKQLEKFSFQSSEPQKQNSSSSKQSQTKDEKEQNLEKIKLTESVTKLHNKEDLQVQQKNEESSQIVNLPEQQPEITRINFLDQNSIKRTNSSEQPSSLIQKQQENLNKSPVDKLHQEEKPHQEGKPHQEEKPQQVEKLEQEEIAQLEEKPNQEQNQHEQPMFRKNLTVSPPPFQMSQEKELSQLQDNLSVQTPSFRIPENPFLSASPALESPFPWTNVQMTPTFPFNTPKFLSNDKSSYTPIQTENITMTKMTNLLFPSAISQEPPIKTNEKLSSNIFQLPSQQPFPPTPVQNIFSMNQPQQQSIFGSQFDQSINNQQLNIFQKPKAEDIFKQEQPRTFMPDIPIQTNLFQNQQQQLPGNMWNNNQSSSQDPFFSWSQQQRQQEPFNQMNQQNQIGFPGNINQQNIQNPFQKETFNHASSIFQVPQQQQQQEIIGIFRSNTQDQQTPNDQSKRINTLKSKLNSQERI